RRCGGWCGCRCHASTIESHARRFHGDPSAIMCRSSRPVAVGSPPGQDGGVAIDVGTVPAVADALRDITISGVFYCPTYVREPWGGAIPPMPGCVWFHVVTSGRCDLVVDGDRRHLEA